MPSPVTSRSSNSFATKRTAKQRETSTTGAAQLTSADPDLPLEKLRILSVAQPVTVDDATDINTFLNDEEQLAVNELHCYDDVTGASDFIGPGQQEMLHDLGIAPCGVGCFETGCYCSEVLRATDLHADELEENPACHVNEPAQQRQIAKPRGCFGGRAVRPEQRICPSSALSGMFTQSTLDSVLMPPPSLASRRSQRESRTTSRFSSEMWASQHEVFEPITNQCATPHSKHFGVGCGAFSAKHLPEYYDSLAKPCACPFCGALCLHSEGTGPTAFAKCCAKGRVVLSARFNDLQNRPGELMALLYNQDTGIARMRASLFKNALAYNSHLSFGQIQLQLSKDKRAYDKRIIKCNNMMQYANKSTFACFWLTQHPMAKSECFRIMLSALLQLSHLPICKMCSKFTQAGSVFKLLTVVDLWLKNIDPALFPLLFSRGQCGFERGLPLRLREGEHVDSHLLLRDAQLNVVPETDELGEEAEFLGPTIERVYNRRDKVSFAQWFRYMSQIRGANWRNPHWLWDWGTIAQLYTLTFNNRAEAQKVQYMKRKQGQRRLVLPSLQGPLGRVYMTDEHFRGSRQYYQREYANCMTICREFGPPDLLVTFTMSPDCPELLTMLGSDPSGKQQQWFDRPDLVCRLFVDKLQELYKDLTERGVLGPVRAWFGALEHQFRGLPHVHTAIILDWERMRNMGKIQTPADYIDEYISAEIPPNPTGRTKEAAKQRALHKTITTKNIHT
uniref:Helitron_like_N domain-containing protein n=1 Tax=Globodera pallida TaxID=36090 RepID=A0A183BR78_GLOPA